MVQINLKSDTVRLMRDLQKRKNAIGERALRRALGRMVKEAFKIVKREVANEMGITQKQLVRKTRRSLWYTKPYRFKGGAGTSWNTSIAASGKPLPLIAFKGVAQRRKGVSVRAWNKARIYPGSFLARMPSGHLGVFVRKSTAYHHPVSWHPKSGQPTKVTRTISGKTRTVEAWTALPIKELFGPSVPRTLAQTRFTALVESLTNTRLPTLINQEVQREMNKQARR